MRRAPDSALRSLDPRNILASPSHPVGAVGFRFQSFPLLLSTHLLHYEIRRSRFPVVAVVVHYGYDDQRRQRSVPHSPFPLAPSTQVILTNLFIGRLTARWLVCSHANALIMIHTASPVAPTTGSLVDASGYKYSEKDTKPGKIRLKKAAKPGKKKTDGLYSSTCYA